MTAKAMKAQIAEISGATMYTARSTDLGKISSLNASDAVHEGDEQAERPRRLGP